MDSGRGYRRWWLAAVPLAGVAWLTTGLAAPYWLAAMGCWLDVGRPPARSDFVFALGGAPNSRPFAAAALVRSGWASRAVVASPPGSEDPQAVFPRSPWADLAVLRGRGLRDEEILAVSAHPRHTYDEAELAASVLADRPDATMMVVTNGSHARRARWVLRRVLGNRFERVRLVTVPDDYFELRRWWRSRMGFCAVTAEYLKLGFYWVWYGPGGGVLGAVLFSVIAVVGVALVRRSRGRQAGR